MPANKNDPDWMTGVFPPDAWDAENITEPTSDDERDLMAYLKPDEQILWAECKVTRRKNMAMILRRLAAVRKTLVTRTF